jgi:Zn-dependent M28 family amino/carboxypeptidase
VNIFIFFALVCFHPDSAFDHIERLGDIGPRPPGTPAAQQGFAYIVDHLEPHVSSIDTQNFQYDGILFSNIIAHIGGGSPRVLLGTHWDTRPIAEKQNPRLPVFGANDGTSGVAVLLELARCLDEKGADYPIDIVLFDGEDYGPMPLILGSRHFAAALEDPEIYEFGIIVDMIGDKDLAIHRERSSTKYAPELVDEFWTVAEELGETSFHPDIKHDMNDDHRPLNEVGIPSILVIDFDYPHWHTLSDTPDKCSPESLGAVGRVLESFLDRRFQP